MSRPVAVVAAAVVPVLAAGLLAATRDFLANTGAALLLVLLVVGAACSGHRSAGLAAAVASGLGFDFFLTQPYLTFSVTDTDDVETLVALVLVGVAVTEVVQWGRRHQARLRDREAYLDALLAISRPHDGDDPDWVDAIGRYLTGLLDLDACHWTDSVDPDAPRLDRDGQIRLHGETISARDGLPIHSTVVLPVRPDQAHSPGFVLTASTHLARPDLRRRRLATALADQTGWSLDR